MQYSASRVKQDYGASGVLYDQGSVYEGFSRITDKRKARGKIYRLETIMMIIVLAKLSGEDKPSGIADWGKHQGNEIVELKQLKKSRMPSLNTYRRILADEACQEEVESMVGKYKQQGEHGEVYGLDGKAVRGMRKKDEEGSGYLLSVYDVKQMKTLAQVEVGRKENEISQAPKALECVEISQKVVRGDAMHTQKALLAQIVRQGGDYIFPVKENQLSLYKNIQQLFAPEYPKAGFGKIQTDFLTVEKVNQGHGRLEKRILTTSEMLNSYSTWPGLAQVYRSERQ